MTLISSIISDGYREANMIPLGKDPRDNQVTEALRLHNATIANMYGNDAGELLQDWPLGNFGRETDDNCWTDTQRQHPLINARLLVLNEAPVTVYLTTQPQDGARYAIADPFGRLSAFPVTLDANGRTIEGAASIGLATDGLNREWFYRSDLGSWVRITDLAATDENPFPKEFDSMFVILLAMRLSPRYGRALDDASIAILKSGRRQFIARYVNSQPLNMPRDISWPFMSKQSYLYGREFGTQTGFETGKVFP